MKIQEILKKEKVSIDPIKELLHQEVSKIIENKVNFVIEHPAEESHGDYATNVAMALAGVLKENPLEIAQNIAKKINLPDLLEKVEAIAPGFINFKIKNDYYISELENILEQKEDYGTFELAEDKKIMLEFGQPNTHKAFTVGHIKGTISGLSVCKLFENLGYEVVKTNYYGDIGMHTAKTTWGVQQKGLLEDFESWDKHKKMEFITEAYVYATQAFDENEKAIRKINIDIYQKNKTEATELYERIKKMSLEHQKAIFADLGVAYDKQYPESQVYESAKKIVEENSKKIFVESQGAIIYEGEKDGLVTWVMKTSEDNPTYLAKDIALGYQKFEDYPDLFLNLTLTGVEQVDHFKAVIKILETLDEKFKDKYFHTSFGWLLMNGKKTSSRSGKNIKGTDILEESLKVARTKIAELKDYDTEKKEEISRVVALAGLKFLILSHDFNKDVNYDPEKFVDFEGYSGPYILYAYVRAQAILRKSKSLEIRLPSDLEMNEWELSLLKWLTRYPQKTYQSGVEVAPYTMCNYLYELAQRFNTFYANCPVIKASEEEKAIRLALSEGTAQVLKNGLTLLGIETIEEM
ncbi:MAG: arginine--tRNA ligase [Candidatus Pacebacteria bacterium]|nr:arginine--tRNA ligase [Candidatus Paceibacterota bacterium]